MWKRLSVTVTLLVLLASPVWAQRTDGGGIRVDGATVLNGQVVKLLDGTAAAPSYSFASQTNTGFYKGGTSQINVALNGVARFALDANSLYLLNNTSSVLFGSAQDMQLRRCGTKAFCIDADGAGGALNSINLYGPTIINSASNSVVALALKSTTATYGTSMTFSNPAASGKYNWRIGNQFFVDNGLEFAPSTAVDGSSFSSPVFSITQAGNALLSGNFGFGAFDASHAMFTPSGQTVILKNGDGSTSGANFGADALLASTIQMNVNGNYIQWASSSKITAPANGQLNLVNAAVSAGIGFDVTTDGTLKIRNRAQNADAALTAGAITASGVVKLNGAGTVGAPSLVIDPANINTGIYNNVNNSIAFATAGARVASMTATIGVSADYVGFSLGGVLAMSITAPIIASGGCTSPAVTNSNGSAAFLVTIGTSCTGVKTVTLTMPAAAHYWSCDAVDNTSPATNVVVATSGGTTSVVLSNYARTTGLALDYTASEALLVKCLAF